MRKQSREIPSFHVQCPFTKCVYNGLVHDSGCDNPRINRGNSDARCHNMNRAQIISHLTRRAPDLGQATALRKMDDGSMGDFDWSNDTQEPPRS